MLWSGRRPRMGACDHGEMTTPAWRELESTVQSAAPIGGDAPEEVAEQVTRYFAAAFEPDATLAPAAVMTMRGSIKIGRWLPFSARQLLAPRMGTVWEATVAGIIRGSDRYVNGSGGMTWKLFGLVPIVRVDGVDVSRSAAERAAGESIWVPSAVAPASGVDWRSTGANSIAAVIDTDGHLVEVEHRIDELGRLTSSSFLRWGDPDRTGTWAQHRFGVEVHEHARFGSVQIPSRGEAGWHHGTGRWREGIFFRFELTDYALLAT